MTPPDEGSRRRHGLEDDQVSGRGACCGSAHSPGTCLQAQAQLVVGDVANTPAQLLPPAVRQAHSHQAEQALAVQVHPRRRLELSRAGGNGADFAYAAAANFT